jgi:hypothetical protein
MKFTFLRRHMPTAPGLPAFNPCICHDTLTSLSASDAEISFRVNLRLELPGASSGLHPLIRIFDADPQWCRYLFGRQRPETQVEAMSWYWRFLLMMTLVRKLSWTCKFKESGLSTI